MKPLQDALEALKTKTLRKDPNAEFGDVLIKAIHEPEKNGKPLVGYTVPREGEAAIDVVIV